MFKICNAFGINFSDLTLFAFGINFSLRFSTATAFCCNAGGINLSSLSFHLSAVNAGGIKRSINRRVRKTDRDFDTCGHTLILPTHEFPEETISAVQPANKKPLLPQKSE